MASPNLSWLILAVTAILAAIRCRPGFPAHNVSWEGSYEAIAHVLVGGMLTGPIVFWVAKKFCKPNIEKFIAYLPWSPDNSNLEKTLVAGNLRNLAAVIDRWFDARNGTAHTSFWSGMFLTFGVEGILFVYQVLLA
jgi:hypothetical protein